MGILRLNKSDQEIIPIGKKDAQERTADARERQGIHNRRIKERDSMKVLLIIPLRSYDPRLTFPLFPDDILSLAAVLEKHGHEVQIYDNNVDTRQPRDFVSFNPDIIGFSVFTGPHITSAIAQSIEFKRIIPWVKVVWGGVHPSILPEQTLREPYIDYVAIGAGEYTLLELVQCLGNGHMKLEEIKGLAYKKDGQIFINEPRPFIKNLDELPDPAWHLVDAKKYSNITLCTGRGCPFRCAFCYNIAFYKRHTSTFTGERVIAQIEYLKKRYGTKHITFFEDNFTGNRRRLHEFCNLVIRRKLKIKWDCDSRADLDEEDIALMAKAGCVSVGLGIETGSQKMLDFIQKDITIEEMEKTFWLLVKYKITPTVYIVYGFPTETIEDFKMSLALLDRLDNPPYLFMKFVPVLGTPLFDYCITNGKITPPTKLSSDWAEFTESTAMKINFSDVPQEMIDEAVNEFRRMYAVQRLRFTIRHNPTYLWKIIGHPLGFFRDLKSLVKHYLMASSELSSAKEVKHDDSNSRRGGEVSQKTHC